MCDRSDKLIAWLDHELSQQEAADLQQHLEACRECRRCLAAYQQVDETIVEYCDAQLDSQTYRGLSFWASALSAAAVVVALLLWQSNFVRHSRQTEVAAIPPAVDSAAIATSAPPRAASVRKVAHRPRAVAPMKIVDSIHSEPAQVQNASWIPAEPAVQIAIPADAVFAPGAIPQGVSFSAELTIGADGSVRQLRLHP